MLDRGAIKFNVIRLSQNRGHGHARRIGLERCNYNYVALMDADDVSVSDRFERQLKCFEEDRALSIVGGQIEEFIDTPDNVIGIRAVPTEDEDIKSFLRKRCPFNQVSVMFKKNDVGLAGGYIDWYCEEDYYLWLRMYQKGMKFKNIDDTLVSVRVGEEMYQRRGGWKYFKSEARLQRYMLKNGIIGVETYLYNVAIRFVVQVLMPNKLRGRMFKLTRVRPLEMNEEVNKTCENINARHEFIINFSVLMCVYKNDNPDHFQQALASVINQTVKPSEIVLVVDGPVPDSIEVVINEYQALLD